MLQPTYLCESVLGLQKAVRELSTAKAICFLKCGNISSFLGGEVFCVVDWSQLEFKANLNWMLYLAFMVLKGL